MKIALAICLLLPALAGCMDAPQYAGPFDGDATLDLVNEIVYDDDGSLRIRSPGMAGHLATADWLEANLQSNGWVVSTESFTGADYAALSKGGVQRYTGPGACSDEDYNQLAGLGFRNVYATLPGTEANSGQVVIAAHWDAKEDDETGANPIPAANDGASGVAVILQLQNHIAQHQLAFPFDVTLALFDGEDGFEDCHPLAGSIYAARAGNTLQSMTQLVLLDMVGDADARFIRETQSTASDGPLVDALWARAAALGYGDNFVTVGKSIVDDHVPFLEEGFQAIDIIDAGRARTFAPYWHTSEDTPDKLSADMLGFIGDLMVWMLIDPDVQPLLQD